MKYREGRGKFLIDPVFYDFTPLFVSLYAHPKNILLCLFCSLISFCSRLTGKAKEISLDQSNCLKCQHFYCMEPLKGLPEARTKLLKTHGAKP